MARLSHPPIGHRWSVFWLAVALDFEKLK